MFWTFLCHDQGSVGISTAVKVYQVQIILYLGTKCYQKSSTKATYKDAEAMCNAMGAMLAEPRTEAENNHLKNQFATGEWIWIGINDRTSEGRSVL